jgi:hypothetical protein
MIYILKGVVPEENNSKKGLQKEVPSLIIVLILKQ